MPKRLKHHGQRNVNRSEAQALPVTVVQEFDDVHALTILQIRRVLDTCHRLSFCISSPVSLVLSIVLTKLFFELQTELTREAFFKRSALGNLWITLRILVMASTLLYLFTKAINRFFPRGLFAQRISFPSPDQINALVSEKEAKRMLAGLNQSIKEQIKMVAEIGLPVFILDQLLTNFAPKEERFFLFIRIIVKAIMYAEGFGILTFYTLEKSRRKDLSSHQAALNACITFSDQRWDYNNTDLNKLDLTLYINEEKVTCTDGRDKFVVPTSRFIRELESALVGKGWNSLIKGNYSLAVAPHRHLADFNSRDLERQLIARLRERYFAKQYSQVQYGNVAKLVSAVMACKAHTAESYCVSYTKTVDANKEYFVVLQRRFFPVSLQPMLVEALKRLYGTANVKEKNDYIKLKLNVEVRVDEKEVARFCDQLRQKRADSPTAMPAHETPLLAATTAAAAAASATPTQHSQTLLEGPGPEEAFAIKRKNLPVQTVAQSVPAEVIRGQVLKVNWDAETAYDETKKDNVVYPMRKPNGHLTFFKIHSDLEKQLSDREIEQLRNVLGNGSYATKGHHSKAGAVGIKPCEERFKDCNGVVRVSSHKAKLANNVRFFAPKDAKLAESNTGIRCKLREISGVVRAYH